MQESYESFLHENFAKDRNILIEQSNLQIMKFFTQKLGAEEATKI